ncbi:MAG: C4-type zinc ribbon domain-containing protein [Terracidiphilus sp.]|jgi:predicted  nucleic acid-binding Zn-ribbon protein
MHEHIESLVKLQSVELGRARLAQQLRALPNEIVQAQAALGAAERQSADASAALSREESARTRLEREIDTHRQKAARFRAQLDSVKTPEQAAAIEHEVQFATAEVDRLESEEYASLERTEAQETALAAARAQVESLSEVLEGVRTRIAARQKELTAELAAFDADREAVRAALGPEWLTRFDRIAAVRGTGIARAENQQCTGCSMGVRPQTWNELREGQLLACDSCSRLLYWDPAMQPTPKAPQPEVIPGAGRAPRKPREAEA